MASPITLHDYQIVARDFLRGAERGAALFLDMGLGKTACVLAALEPRHLPVLVVAPKRVAEHVWEAERGLWRPDLTISVAQGSPAGRAASLASGADIVVLSRDNIRDLEKPGAPRFRTVVIDELSGFKSRASVRWKTMKKIVLQPSVKHVWGLTGTPVPNGLMDLWAQIALLDSGARLGKNITAYRDRYFYAGRQLRTGVVTEWIPRPESEAAIHGKLEDICLSMATDGRIVLPGVTYNAVEVDLPARAVRAYRDISRDLVADLRDVFGGEIHTAASAAILTMKLSQLAAGFLYVDDADLRGRKWTQLHEEKINAVLEIIEAQGGSPVLVFYRFQAELEMLRKAIPQASVISDKDAIAAWNRGEIPVLLAHPASAGHGLNLQHGGHTIVWSSLTWSPDEWEQGNKRLARQGQKHPVVVHSVFGTLAGKRTIDHLIRDRLVDKAAIQDALLDHLESPI